MTMQMNGYHCYRQLKEPSEWYEIELLVQYMSALYWKRNGGKIGIYTEPKHLSILDKYKMTNIYDFVDSETLLRLPSSIDINRFWALSKLLCHNNISESEYCILDTDMYLRKVPTLPNVSFVGAHPETHNTAKGQEVYKRLEEFLDLELYEKYKDFEEVKPINTSFMYINDKELVHKWTEVALQIAKHISKSPSFYGEMMTIEQRFLPIVCEELNKSYSSLISNSYLTAKIPDTDGKEWDPYPYTGGNLLEVSKYFFHLWGLKQQLNNKVLRDSVMRVLVRDIDLDFPQYYSRIKKKFPTIKQYFK